MIFFTTPLLLAYMAISRKEKFKNLYNFWKSSPLIYTEQTYTFIQNAIAVSKVNRLNDAIYTLQDKFHPEAITNVFNAIIDGRAWDDNWTKNFPKFYGYPKIFSTSDYLLLFLSISSDLDLKYNMGYIDYIYDNAIFPTLRLTGKISLQTLDTYYHSSKSLFRESICPSMKKTYNDAMYPATKKLYNDIIHPITDKFYKNVVTSPIVIKIYELHINALTNFFYDTPLLVLHAIYHNSIISPLAKEIYKTFSNLLEDEIIKYIYNNLISSSTEVMEEIRQFPSIILEELYSSIKCICPDDDTHPLTEELDYNTDSPTLEEAEHS